jgi:hypothetical protein
MSLALRVKPLIIVIGMAKKKRELPSRSAPVDDCNADILPMRSKKPRDESKTENDAAAEATAAPQSRRARKVAAC